MPKTKSPATPTNTAGHKLTEIYPDQRVPSSTIGQAGYGVVQPLPQPDATGRTVQTNRTQQGEQRGDFTYDPAGRLSSKA